MELTKYLIKLFLPKIKKKNMALVRLSAKEGSKTSSEAVAHKKTKPVMYEVKIYGL